MTQKLMEWLEKEIGLDDYAKYVAKRDFLTALSTFSASPNKDNWGFVKDMFKYIYLKLGNVEEIVYFKLLKLIHSRGIYGR